MKTTKCTSPPPLNSKAVGSPRRNQSSEVKVKKPSLMQASLISFSPRLFAQKNLRQPKFGASPRKSDSIPTVNPSPQSALQSAFLNPPYHPRPARFSITKSSLDRRQIPCSASWITLPLPEKAGAMSCNTAGSGSSRAHSTGYSTPSIQASTISQLPNHGDLRSSS